MPPAGNNGLRSAIRGDVTGKTGPAYNGMTEIQVLDDTSPQYAKLDPRQYNGSAYGMVAAHRGYLRPVGEWNFEEVTVKGSTIKVELNGTLDPRLRPEQGDRVQGQASPSRQGSDRGPFRLRRPQ